MRSQAGALAALAIIVGGATAACGSNGPDLPDRLTACEVVTAAEVADALDRPVTDPAESSEAATDQLAGRSGCAWSSDDERMAVLVELVRTGDMSRSVRRTGFSATARFRAAAADHPTGMELDIGDRSLFVEELAKVWVLEGDDLVTFEVAVTPPSRARPVAEQLASSAARRLARSEGDERAD